MENNERFTKVYVARNEHLERIEELEDMMLDEQDDIRLGEIVALLDHHKTRVSDINSEIVYLLSKPEDQKLSLPKVLNLGIGRR